MNVTRMVGQRTGLLRSLYSNHMPPGRINLLAEFYKQLLQPGELAFDIGAHVGTRVRAWRHLGVRVVAIEPQQFYYHYLKRKFKRDQDVRVYRVALGDQRNIRPLFVSDRTPCGTSMSKEWMDAVQSTQIHGAINWNRVENVEVMTLDDLIKRVGMPRFCKIDVEGLELEIVSGLSQAIPSLSFTYMPLCIDMAIACIDRMTKLGVYRFNRSDHERWAHERWYGADEIKDDLYRLPTRASVGTLYAVRNDCFEGTLP